PTIPYHLLFFFSRSGHHRHLHSFPTRRSSDLVTTGRTHNASAEMGREKSGKNDVASPAPGDAARISPSLLNSAAIPPQAETASRDRKSTRLNSSHDQISYAVFCLKKKKRQKNK